MGETIKNTSTKIPFKVSARTARLIGRENIATSKGAIIELVKNAYDADSGIAIVFFDNKYSTFLSEMSEDHFETLVKKGIDKKLLDIIYKFEEENYTLNSNIDEDKLLTFKKAISRLSVLYIIDAGEGMTQNVIREHWMTIGTDNKSNNVFTKTGRVKAGAKGIGRFALDKLGSKCEMTTIFNPKYHHQDTDINGEKTNYKGYKWKVDWEDFEGEYKTIDSVGAELFGLLNSTIKGEITEEIPSFDFSKISSKVDFEFGTILKISDLRDNWEDYYVQQVYSDLEVLVPPKETGGFEIYLFSSLEPNKYGEVFSSICDDFDFKLTAIADENQNVKIKIERREYDIELIPNEFFERDALKKFPYTKEIFKKGFWETSLTFSQLLKGFKDVDEDNIFSNIGVFEFSFYFLKRTYDTPNADRFFYRRFMSNDRKDWLNKFGGIKLFRDNFRVRPYGEVKDAAFDWLGLGSRKSTSPAGVAKKEGGYRVEPENVAGAVKISRLTNVNFEDKSSREGLQDNKTFQIFKQLLASIINVFEEDRSYIAREMSDFDDFRFGAERDLKAAEELAKRILESSRAKKKEKESTSGNKEQNTGSNQTGTDSDREKEILASKIESQEEEIEKLKEEQKVLRGLASSGIVLASFSHDLSKLNDVLNSRTDKLKGLLLSKIAEAEYEGIEDRKNPFFQLEKIKKQDLKLQNWLNFSLGATRKDKRKRKQLFLKKYFSDLSVDWSTVLENRGINFDVTDIENLDLRVYEIDFDSIFNNLLVNSIDAFTILKINRAREIKIKAKSTNKEIIIDYYDNGPGLSDDILDPNKIFEPLFTTRRNPFTGEEEGTGLGMWLVKSIVSENDGTLKLLFPDIGFGIRMIFPIKYKR
ncbi:ATP-binding protein [Cecembia lonarensis]|jgi:signal transduction histidine kinase|uniref:histidine kinase n=1 Tax=Cecembia lonarensis (strain CCUG 58316 / KCTC 22772 / LW9) TaxID=1225176 RepID=K1KVL9_CECL9|nr:ATP-binding protein [Cecembia lonarensis]EKB48190.1 sensory histidine kinase AtoS [Cecembia lonarensis LW9]